MTVYIGIVTYNSIADLPACFEALDKQTFVDRQIIVLDNRSSDGSAEWVLSRAPDVTLIRNQENIGYGRAHNLILRTLRLNSGDYYLTINPDAQLAPGYITALIDSIRDQTQIGWATGKLLLKSDQEQTPPLVYSAGHGILRSGFAFNIGYGLPDGKTFSSAHQVFGAPGAAALYKAELIESISENGAFFDPIMFMYAEDTDVDWRAQRSGWQCWFVPEAVASHRGSSPSGRLKSMAIGNRYLSVLKNATPFDLLTYNLTYLLAHCLARLILTPRFGIRLITHILRGAPSVIRRRSPSLYAQQTREWFHWSARQPSQQRPGLQRILRRLPLQSIRQPDRGDEKS